MTVKKNMWKKNSEKKTSVLKKNPTPIIKKTSDSLEKKGLLVRNKKNSKEVRLRLKFDR